MELLIEHRAIWATAFSLFLLLFLILKFKANAFISLLSCAILAALLAGMNPDAAYQSVKKGMGGTLGFIAPVIGLGAIFGAIMEKSGAITILANKANGIKTDRGQTFGAGLIGLLAAIPVFFDVALIILLPFIAKLAAKAKKAPMFIGLPVCVGLAIGHAFIPPTPGPIAIAELINANLGHVMIIGLISAVICLCVAGPALALWMNKKDWFPDRPLDIGVQAAETQTSISFTKAFLILLFPIFLIMAGTITKTLLPDTQLASWVSIVGHPFSALILACALAWFALAPKTVEDKDRLKTALNLALAPTAIVILVTGAGGAFKEVLIDSGAGKDIAGYFMDRGLRPVLLAFSLALVIRMAQGSATVAMITAAGLMAPILSGMNLNEWQLAILTISIAAGATGFSHVNDSGFWLVSRLFNLTEKETLRTWTLATGLIALTGLVSCLFLYNVVF